MHPQFSSARRTAGLVAISIGVVATFVFVVPGCHVIDADPIPERTDVQEVCRVDGKWLRPFGPGNHTIVGAEAAVALLSDSNQVHWLLHSADCALQEVKFPPAVASERLDVVSLTSAGEVRLAMIGPQEFPLRYVLLDVAAGKNSVTTMRQPADGARILPRFSSDGRWAAWIAAEQTENERVQGGPTERLEAEFDFEPAARFGRGSYSVVDVLPSGREILLGKDYGESFSLVDRTGSPIWTFKPDTGVLTTLDNIRLSRDGQAYLTWDGYRGQGRYVVQWRIAGHVVRRELPPHSTIASAAVSSDWKWIAASSQANTRAGLGTDSVNVWSTDGTVRFHKRLRDATRTPVVFLTKDLLGYVEVDEKWRGTTRVVRLSPDGSR